DGDDADLRDLAREELAESNERLAELGARLRSQLVPRDPLDEKNVIVEIRAGEGGEEAALFALDLYRMYSRYAERHRWRTEILSQSLSEKGGFKEVIFRVAGKGAYSKLKFESGVHRVQRVPATEAQGRIHASTATVAVLPAAEEREAAESSARRAQIGRGERAEKMRTYNFPQDRITDRRLGYNVSNIERRMDGEIDEMIDALAAQDEADRLSRLEEDGD